MTVNSITPQPVGAAYWNEHQVAERLAVSVKWLRNMRLAGRGIPYAKFARSVRYRIADVLAFEEAAIRTSTSDPGAC